MTWTRGNDWGGYAYNVRNAELHDEGECGFFISQAGGPGTSSLLAAARAAGQIAGTYYWNTALKSVSYQLDEYSRLIDQDQPDVIVIDFEHYWSKWDQYWAAIRGEISWSQVERMPTQKISDSGMHLAYGIRERYPEKYLLIYSADWFIAGYSPQSVTWIKEFPFFVASYPDYGVEKYSLTWDEIRRWQFKHLRVGMQTLTNWRPTLPTGLTAWDMWQYSSRITIPGEQYAYDWIAFNGSLTDLRVRCGLQAPPVNVTWEQKITSWARTVDPPYVGPDPEDV